MTTKLNGKANSNHNHSASNITSGTLPVTRGGTGVTSIDALKSALGISSGGGTSYDIVSSGVGTIVKWANKNWIVCHYEDGKTYLAGLFFVSAYQRFNIDESTVYAGSDLAQACVTYQNTIPSDSLALAVNTTVNGVTNKIFVASYEQMNGGFMLFYSNSMRVLNNQHYWTSSAFDSSFVWLVNNDGSFYNSHTPINTGGFRPFVALQL